MTMQIHTIVLYNKDGRTREINFKLNAVNIITGNSSTGKSSLIDIVEYCFSKSGYNDTLRKQVVENIAAYGVLYQLNDRQIFVAKKTTQAKSRSHLFFTEGKSIIIPALEDIEDNSNDDELKNHLSSLTGIPENEVEPSSNISKYSANIRHAVHYIFMDEPSSKKHLFYKQDQPEIPRTIKETLPVFLGVVQADYVALKRLLRQQKGDQRSLKAEIDTAEEMKIRGISLVPGLLREAQKLGILSPDTIIEELPDGRATLQNLVDQGVPKVIVDTDISAYSDLEQKLNHLRQEEAIQQTQLAQFQSYQHDTTQYERAASEHEHRLSMHEYFDDDVDNTCPICGSEVEHANQDVRDLQEAHQHIKNQVETVQLKRPVLTDAIDSAKTNLRDTRQQIRQIATDIQTITDSQAQARRIQIPRQQIAHFLGSVEMFLRLAPLPEDDLLELKQKLRQLDLEIEELLAQIEQAEGIEQKESAIFNISRYMTEYGDQIGEEYRGATFRFLLEKLSVVVTQLGDYREYHRVGSDKNQLQIHLSLYLAFHRYFIENNCPVPRFMLIDQIDRPFYPDDVNYNSIRENNPEDLMKDPDRQALMEIVELFTAFCEEYDFQIILLQHANFPNDEYQDAVIENWRGNNALVPLDWISEDTE